MTDEVVPSRAEHRLKTSWRHRFGWLTSYVILCVYPVYFLWAPLTSASGSQMGRGTSDLNGGILYAEILSRMQWPFSANTFTNAPVGESFWTPLTIPQGIINLLLWATSHVVPATNAIAVISAIGWIFTGFALFWLSRDLGAGRWAATAAALVGQTLPWFQLKSASHLSYLYSGIVLVTWIATIRLSRRMTARAAVALCASATITAITDTYLFYFTILGVFVIILIAGSSRRLRLWTGSLLGAALLIRVFFGDFLIGLENSLLDALQQSHDSGQRPLRIATHPDVSAWTSSLIDYVRPWPEHLLTPQLWSRSIETDFAQDFVNYAGVVCIIVGIAGIWIGLRSSRRRVVLALAILLGLFVLISVNFGSSLGAGVGLADLFAPFMPGSRVFSRAGILAQLLMIVMTSLALSRISRIKSSRPLNWILFIALVTLMLLDLNPVGARQVLVEKRSYETFSSILKSDPDARLAVFPSSGRWYLDASYLDTPVVNGLKRPQRIAALEAAAQEGTVRFWCESFQQGVTHVVAPIGGNLKEWDQTPATAAMKEPYFTLREASTVSGSYSNYRILIGLYSVNRDSIQILETPCQPTDSG